MKVFIDCMIYLHYQSIKAIDLPSILSCKNLSIMIPRITLRELDKHKNTHPSQRIRDRAQRVLKEIEKWISGDEKVRHGVSVEFYTLMPTIDYAQYGLKSDWNDDILIATILQYKKDYPEENPLLITQESGLKLIAEHIGIKVYQLSEEYKIPAEPDPIQKENRELKRTLLRLQNTSPQLHVCFSGSVEKETYAKFVLSLPPELKEQEIKQTIEDLREKFPKQFPPEPKSAKKGKATTDLYELTKLVGLHNSIDLIPVYEYERYNNNIDAFLADYERYIRNTLQISAIAYRVIQFQIEIHNNGTAPAEDIDVELHFPDGFELLEKDIFPKLPKEPTPPTEPRTQNKILADSMTQIFQMPDHGFRLPTFPHFDLPSGFTIKKTNSYTVTDHFPRIKHGDYVILPEMFIIFDSYESASSFNCDYTIRPANLPDPIMGQLHFVIQKEI